MKNCYIYFLLGILILTSSCKSSDKYTKHNSGFEYKIIFNSKEGTRVKTDDIIELNLKYFTSNDSLIFNTDDFAGNFRVTVLENDRGLFQEAVKLLKPGDSASFKIQAKDFFEKTRNVKVPDFISENDILRFQLKIKKIVSKEEIEKEIELLSIKKETEENLLLEDYIKKNGITVKPSKTGLYIIALKKGKGKKAQIGKKVTIHYTGSFINNMKFASTIEKDKPFEFVLGQEEVIPAWNEAVAKMKVGDKIKIITPSKLAYGSQGSGHSIKPFTPLIFEIKLLSAE